MDRIQLIEMLLNAGITVDESDDTGTVVSITDRNGNEIIFLFKTNGMLYAVEVG